MKSNEERSIKLRVINGGMSQSPGRETVQTFEGPYNDPPALVKMFDNLRKIYHCDYRDIKEKAYGWVSAGAIEVNRRAQKQAASSTGKTRKRDRKPSKGKFEKMLAKVYMVCDIGSPSQVDVLFGTVDSLAEQLKEDMKLKELRGW